MFGTFQEHPKVNINKNIIFIMKNLEKLNQNQKKTKIKLLLKRSERLHNQMLKKIERQRKEQLERKKKKD